MCDPLGYVTDFLSDVGDAVSNFVERILDDPLPVIATVALNAIGVPAYISSPAITAIRGGSMEDMALNMAAGYVGGNLSAGFASEVFGDLPIEIAPEMASTANRELFKTVLTNASPGALVAAARGASFENILEGAVSNAVSGLVGQQIQTELGLDPSQISDKILGNTINSATRSILNGQDPSSAIGASLANSALGTAVNTATGELRSTLRNIETTGNQYKEQIESANNFLEEVLEPQRNWLVENQDEVQNLIANFESKKASLLDAKDIYDLAVAAHNERPRYFHEFFNPNSPTYKLATKLGYKEVFEEMSGEFGTELIHTYRKGEPRVVEYDAYEPDGGYWYRGSYLDYSTVQDFYPGSNQALMIARKQADFINTNAPALEEQYKSIAPEIEQYNQTNQEFQNNLAKHRGLVASADQYKSTLDSLFGTRDQQTSNVNDLVNQVFSTGLILGKDVAEDISGKTISLLDEATVSPEEAMRAFESAGYTPTQEELARFLGERPEAAAFQDIQDYVDAENARQLAAHQAHIAGEEQQLIENESARQEADTIGQIAQEERDLIESDQARHLLDYQTQYEEELNKALGSDVDLGTQGPFTSATQPSGLGSIKPTASSLLQPAIKPTAPSLLQPGSQASQDIAKQAQNVQQSYNQMLDQYLASQPMSVPFIANIPTRDLEEMFSGQTPIYWQGQA
jgi:hypothetical protein